MVSVSNLDTAKRLLEELCSLLFKDGFHLTNWLCNSPEVLKKLGEDELAKPFKDYGYDVELHERVHGGGMYRRMIFASLLRCQCSHRPGQVSCPLSIRCSIRCVCICRQSRIAFIAPHTELDGTNHLPAQEIKRWVKWLLCHPQLQEVSVKRN